MVTIRQVKETDGLAFSQLLKQLDAETPFMAMGEHNSAEELSQHLGLFIDSAVQVLFVVEAQDKKLIGFAIGIAGYIVATVIQRPWLLVSCRRVSAWDLDVNC